MVPVSAIGMFNRSVHGNYVAKGNAFPSLRLPARNNGQRPGNRRALENRATTRESAELADFVPNPPLLDGEPQRKWNAIALAFLGDSVWELYIRRQGMLSAKKLKDLYSWTRDRVIAESQSECFDRLHEGSFITETEREILRWGKNTKKASMPKRLKGALSVEIYRQSTAIECLIGYLYLSDPIRLHTLMEHLQLVEDMPDPNEAN
ncbi:hypothetical protein BSKO_11228 [Bryopsis sp. KO-2023]|nr:hypothetical protein BSKO_11228 [Bryopsis sp. KO-2023]